MHEENDKGRKMPIHDWTRLHAGEFHDFHQAWAAQIRSTLNQGLLPKDFYALIEQSSGVGTADVLTLHRGRDEAILEEPAGTVAVETAPPEVQISLEMESPWYLSKQSRVVVRHVSGNRVVAMIEILSPGNKGGTYPWEKFLEKAVAALEQGIHLLLIDLFPPTARDPQGVPGALWAQLGDESFRLPLNKRLTLSSFVADVPIRAYIEPVAVGTELIPMPLFLTPQRYVRLPLEATYLEAFRGVPLHLQAELR